MLIHHHRWKKAILEAVENPYFFALSGSLSVLFGLLILIPHHVWVKAWPVMITVIGWVFLLQGISRLFFPKTVILFTKDLLEKKGFLLISWVWFLIGLYLLWAGFTQ